MSTILILGTVERRRIAAAVEQARARPIPFDEKSAIDSKGGVVSLSDRNPLAPKRPSSQHLTIPIGFRASFSCEAQPQGLVAHLSVSYHDEVPQPEPFEAIANAFGCSPETERNTWIEEFMIGGQPGGRAMNVVWLLAPKDDT